jgi:hypothetical protein
MGTNGDSFLAPFAAPGKQKPRLSGAFRRLRGKDSNLDYLIQSRWRARNTPNPGEVFSA